MIKMICGACRVNGELKRASDGPFSLHPAEEHRLVGAGVAEYVIEPPPGPVATPGEGGDGGAAGETMPENVTASTGTEPGESDGVGEDTAELMEGEAEAPDTLDIVDGHFTIESLMKLSRTNMEKLAADLGVDVKKCKNKSEIAALLAAVEVKTDDGCEAPPELGVEGPVA